MQQKESVQQQNCDGWLIFLRGAFGTTQFSGRIELKLIKPIFLSRRNLKSQRDTEILRMLMQSLSLIK